MTQLDLRWKKEKKWWTINEKWEYSLTPEAPQEAVESFEHYQKQIREKSKDPKRQII